MNYLGIDVAKAKLDCCLLLETEGTKRKSKVVPNTPEGFQQLIQWCEKKGFPPSQLHAVLEGTGCYHEPAAFALFQAGMRVSVANPARVKDFGKALGILTKNDGIDAFVLARFGALTKPALWQPPPQEVRHLQALLARRDAMENDLQREKNRLEKMNFTEVPQLVMDSLREHIAFLEKALKTLSQNIDSHIDQHPKFKENKELLQSIPGVGDVTSVSMLAVLLRGGFNSAEQVAAYLGLVPVERQSGSSVKGRSRLSKNGPAKVRAKLYMPAVVAIHRNPHIKALAERMAQKGKCKMSIIGAAMRKLVHLCFGVVKNRIPYQPNFEIRT